MWEDNTEISFIQIGRGGMDWIGVVEDRARLKALLNTFRFSKILGNSLSRCSDGSFSRRVLLHGVGSAH
jgi:hypothetical protein